MSSCKLDLYFDFQREVLIITHDDQFRGFVKMLTPEYLILDIGKSVICFPFVNVLRIAQKKESIPQGHYTPSGEFISAGAKEPVEEWL